jgi:DNA invertase Pin-like site-specific DNA recombinase
MSSYFLEGYSHYVMLSSYLPILLSPVKSRNPFGRDFWVEELGGNGSRVAAYLRVSTERQARGLSLEVQKEKLDGMKDDLKPSRVYWFVDTGVSGEDFDRRKLKKILELREKKMVGELWVTHIDRIGRACRKSLLFFLQFAEDDGVIRTPGKTFTTKELADILVYAIESYGAENENKRRAERANASRIQNFKSKKWNKPIPLGYTPIGDWIAKAEGYEQIIKDIFNNFLLSKSVSKTVKSINGRYGEILDRPLKRGRLKNLLMDPVYIGQPVLMGVSVVDERLRYIDDETFNKCKELLKAKKEQKPEKLNTLIQLALKYDILLLDFLKEVVDFHHRKCGGRLVKNGSRFEGLILQQVFKCNLCGSEFRIPTKSMLNKLLNQDKSEPRAEAQTAAPKTSETQQKIGVKAERNLQKTLLDFWVSH